MPSATMAGMTGKLEVLCRDVLRGPLLLKLLNQLKDFSWDGPSSVARDAIHQVLKAQGAEPVDVVNINAQTAGRVRQDGVPASAAAPTVFQDARLTDGLSVRVVWTPTGDPGAQEYHLNVKLALHPNGGKARRLVREATVVCGDPRGRSASGWCSGMSLMWWRSSGRVGENRVQWWPG